MRIFSSTVKKKVKKSEVKKSEIKKFFQIFSKEGNVKSSLKEIEELFYFF